MKNPIPVMIIEGVLGRWVIVSAANPTLAWTGSRWAGHNQGVPTHDIQISNFGTRSVAEKEAGSRGFVITQPQSGE